MLLALLAACGFPHRIQKSLLAPDYVTEAAPVGEIAAVTYDTGARGDTVVPYRPTLLEADGRTFHEAVEITSSGFIDVAPLVEGAQVRLWMRSGGLERHDFVPVLSVTGALDGRFPNEVRFLPERLSAPLHLPLRQLHNVYNEYDLGHGDLLLVEVRADDREPERYLFKAYEFGPRFKYGGGLLVTVPLGFLEVDQPEKTSAIIAFTTSFGYRFRTRSPVLRWIGGNSALIVSTGVGSTAVLSPDLNGDLGDQVLGHFDATIAGGGLELYDFVSAQALVNLSAFGRDAAEAPWVLSIGFDAVQFGVFMRDLGTRLFRKNVLVDATPP